MVRKITEISSLWTFPGDFLISVHSIIAVSLTIMIAEKSKEVWLMKQRYYLALTTEEWRLMIESLKCVCRKAGGCRLSFFCGEPKKAHRLFYPNKRR